jgi:hypothetical protein
MFWQEPWPPLQNYLEGTRNRYFYLKIQNITRTGEWLSSYQESLAKRSQIFCSISFENDSHCFFCKGILSGITFIFSAFYTIFIKWATEPYVRPSVRQFECWCIENTGCETSLCGEFTFTISPLRTKGRLLYLKAQFVPRSKHFSTRL